MFAAVWFIQSTVWGNVRVTPVVTSMAFETDVMCREMATQKAFVLYMRSWRRNVTLIPVATMDALSEISM